MSLRKYRTNNISSPDIPEGPGIYAWYADLHLPEKDTNDLIGFLQKNEIKKEIKYSVLLDFLNRKLLQPFKESQYNIKISGKLKPKYFGKIDHQQEFSDGLIEKIIEDPNRLKSLYKILKSIDTSFLSPIYIGMAGNLKTRLTTHINQINNYYNNLSSSSEFEINTIEESLLRDHKFALEAIVVRKIEPKKLYFTFYEVDFDNKIESDLENILNRLNYPLCGRN